MIAHAPPTLVTVTYMIHRSPQCTNVDVWGAPTSGRAFASKREKRKSNLGIVGALTTVNMVVKVFPPGWCHG